ncbi:uncharacterized protein DS421_2g53280 [Arachis hypogaea]|nr:uncharacterized protein DS421_2g53280 [Arachis hypogaea]
MASGDISTVPDDQRRDGAACGSGGGVPAPTYSETFLSLAIAFLSPQRAPLSLFEAPDPQL